MLRNTRAAKDIFKMSYECFSVVLQGPGFLRLAFPGKSNTRFNPRRILISLSKAFPNFNTIPKRYLYSSFFEKDKKNQNGN